MSKVQRQGTTLLESESFSLVHRCIIGSFSQKLEGSSLPLRDVVGAYLYLKMLAGDGRNAWPSQQHLVEQLGVSRQTVSLWLSILVRWGLVKSYLVINDKGIHSHYLVFDHICGCEWRVERPIPTAEELNEAGAPPRCYLCRTGGRVRELRSGGGGKASSHPPGCKAG